MGFDWSEACCVSWSKGFSEFEGFTFLPFDSFVLVPISSSYYGEAFGDSWRLVEVVFFDDRFLLRIIPGEDVFDRRVKKLEKVLKDGNLPLNHRKRLVFLLEKAKKEKHDAFAPGR